MQHATPGNAQRHDPAAGKPAAKWPQHAPCGHFAVTEAIEQQRTRANGVPRSPVFSGVFARVRWPSRDMKESGRTYKFGSAKGFSERLQTFCKRRARFMHA
jgi:hypothetical protein